MFRRTLCSMVLLAALAACQQAPDGLSDADRAAIRAVRDSAMVLANAGGAGTPNSPTTMPTMPSCPRPAGSR